MNRREFCKLVIGTAACTMAPAVFFARTAATADSKLDRICWRIGEVSRELNWTNITRIVTIDEYGRLVLHAQAGFDVEQNLFLADRNLVYTKLGFRTIERRYLDRASTISCFVTANGVVHKVEY